MIVSLWQLPELIPQRREAFGFRVELIELWRTSEGNSGGNFTNRWVPPDLRR